MIRVAVMTLALVVVFAGVSHSAARDDYRFAEELVKRGYYDLARGQFERIIGDRSRSPQEQAAGELGLALLLKAQATDSAGITAKPAEEILKQFESARLTFEKFLTNHPNHPMLVEARFELGNLLQAQGSFLNVRMDREPEKAEEYRSAAEKAFGSANDLFRDVAESLEPRVDRMQESDEGYGQLWWQASRARFFEAATQYNKGILYPMGSPERVRTLRRANELLDDFVWDHEGDLLGGYASLYYGLSHSKLDDPASAFEYLSSAADLPLQDPARYPEEYLKWSDLVLQAYFKIGEYANEVGERDGRDYRRFAVEKFVEMMSRIPDVWERKFGHLAILEHARCLLGLGEFEPAMALAIKVSEEGASRSGRTEWGAAIEFNANRLLNEIIVDAGARGIEIQSDPEVLFKAAMGKKTSRQWNAAIRAFQGVIRASDTPAEIEQYAIPSWLQIGESYYRDEKYLEAYFAYDHMEKTWSGKEIAGEAAYYRYRAASALSVTTKDPTDQALAQKARSDFATKYPSHPFSVDLQYYEGADLIADADAARAADKPGEAKAMFDQALARLREVKQSSILYAKAQARMGEILYKLERPDEAIAALEQLKAWIADPRQMTTNPDRLLNRLQGRALATYYQALSYRKKESYEKVLATLDGYEKEFDDENVRNFHAPVKFERVRAAIGMGDLDRAEKDALDLREQFPDDDRTPIAFSLLGNRYYEAAVAAVQRKDPAARRTALRKAADYTGYYVRRRGSEDWQDYYSLGVWYDELQMPEESVPALEKANRLQTARLAQTLTTEQREELSKAQENLLRTLSRILLARQEWDKARALFENLIVVDPLMLPRVKALLDMGEADLTRPLLDELQAKMKFEPLLMESLATVYRAGGDPLEMRRAVRLLKLLLMATRDKYGDDAWRWNYQLLLTYNEYGESQKDRTAFDNVITLVNGWEGVGVLKTSPYEKEIKDERARALRNR